MPVVKMEPLEVMGQRTNVGCLYVREVSINERIAMLA